MSHVTLLDLSLDKENFTRHGMHLYSKGKEKVARIIGQYINEQLNRLDNTIIIIPWTKDNKYPISLMESEVPAVVWLTEVMLSNVRVSERSKKPPVTRYNEVLWSTNKMMQMLDIKKLGPEVP